MSSTDSFPKRHLGLFQLVMINVIAVDSIRTLPFSASYGFSLIFYYLLAAFLFFIPTAFIAAELGTAWPITGGIYVWVREAFGKKCSLVVIWLHWIYNVIWFPTIVALTAGTAAYFFDVSLQNNKCYLGISVLIIFWLATLLNLFGMKLSSWISSAGALIGTLIPMLLIAILGLIWWKKGNTLAISFTKESFFPAISSNKNIAYLTNVLFGLMGLEMAATHSREMINPKKDYPRSLAISVGIILFSIITSSLAVSVVIPPSDLNLVTGAMQAFSVFFNSLQIPWGIPILAGCIILGGVSGISAWIIGPTKGLMVASEDGSLPKCLSKKNRWGVPSNLLLLQAGLVSILCLAFVIYPTVNSSFWILSVITAQLALVVYIFLYLAAFKLHFSKSQVPRPFRIPGGKWGVGICASLGCLSSVVVCILGFIPPEAVSNEGVISYEISIISGMLVAIGIPLFIIKKMSKKKNKLS